MDCVERCAQIATDPGDDLGLRRGGALHLRQRGHLFGEVLDDSNKVTRCAGFVSWRSGCQPTPEDPSVGPDIALVDDDPFAASVAEAREVGRCPVEIVRMGDVLDLDGPLAGAKQIAKCLVVGHLATLEVQ